MVGVTAAVPLDDEYKAQRAPTLKAEFDTPGTFYFGEAVLLPEYWGRGHQRRFFEVREKKELDKPIWFWLKTLD